MTNSGEGRELPERRLQDCTASGTHDTSFLEEQSLLSGTYAAIRSEINEYRRIIRERQEQLKALMGYGYERLPDVCEYRAKLAQYNREAGDLERMLPQLWFGRIDFQHEGDCEAKVYYIGKRGYEVQGVKILDWRAPAAELFYSRGNSYVAPGGAQRGHLRLVRHLEVEHDRLKKLVDYPVEEVAPAGPSKQAATEFFITRLERRGKERFKDVVETIQPEQNEVIRFPADRHLIVQGPAGTGKSIVLLHRAAYLIYASKCRPQDIFILAPNPLLIEQIAGILPDLGVNDVEQMTVEEFAWRIIGHRSDAENLGFSVGPVPVWMVPGNRSLFAEIWAVCKGSTSLPPERLDKIAAVARTAALNELKPVSISAGRMVPVSEIRAFFQREVVREQPYSQQLRLFSEWLVDRVFEELRGKQVLLDEEEQERYTKKAKQIADGYLSQILKPDQLFWLVAVPAYVVAQKELYSLLGSSVIPEGKMPEFTLDDLAALLYLYTKIFGVPRKYRFILVDEAHSLNPLWLRVLKQFLRPTGTITLAGDANQVGLSSWNLSPDTADWDWAMVELGEKAEVKKLSIVYRTTRPIADYLRRLAARIASGAGAEFTNAGRPGEPVRSGYDLDKFLDFLRCHPDIRTAAVIAPTEERAEELKATCARKPLKELPCIPKFFALTEVAGTEFDAVFVADTAAYEASPRALYTAASRAVHYLFLD